MKKLKVMVTGEQDGIIWDMASEDEISINTPIYELLNNEINLHKWQAEYWKLYKEWLEHDAQLIFDIKSPVNTSMIEAITKFNTNNATFKLYYWFDVNRDLSPDFAWQYCPLTEDKLQLLPQSYHRNNRLISPSQPLVFPLC